jgi:hypothetical protein
MALRKANLMRSLQERRTRRGRRKKMRRKRRRLGERKRKRRRKTMDTWDLLSCTRIWRLRNNLALWDPIFPNSNARKWHNFSKSS